MKLSKARKAQLAHFGPLPEGRVYLVIGEYVWGKAPDIETAVLNAAKNSSALLNSTAKLIVYDAEARTYVDGMGGLTWYPADPDYRGRNTDPNYYRKLGAFGGTREWRNRAAQ